MNTLNVSLFIKRAEEYQTKEFIINIFHKKNIGKVNEVKFIKKQNHTGKSYNGVIVSFEKWYNNNLLNEILKNGTFKFNFNNSYWFINVHKEVLELEECKEFILPTNLSDTDRIKQLEDLVKSMSSQINYMQTKQERSERTIMDYEHKHTQQHLNNIELRAQLDDKDAEQSWIESDFKEDIETLKAENQLLSEHLERKYYECLTLKEELKEQTCMLDYTENKVQHMVLMLKELPCKQVIDTYIKEYC